MFWSRQSFQTAACAGITALMLLVGIPLTHAKGGGSSTGGGNGFVCFGPLVSVQFAEIRTFSPFAPHRANLDLAGPEANHIVLLAPLDLMVARHRYTQLDLMDLDEEPLDYIRRLISQLRPTSQKLADQLSRQLSRTTFKIETNFAPQQQVHDYGNISDILDATESFQTRDAICGFTTLALQNTQNDITEVRVRQQTLRYQRPDAIGALYLHELVYAWARDLSHPHSQPTRTLVAAILAHPEQAAGELEALARRNGFYFD